MIKVVHGVKLALLIKLLFCSSTVDGITFERFFGGDNTDIGTSVHQTSDGGYIVGGYTKSWGLPAFDFIAIKLDSSGNSQWSKTYGGDNVDICWCVTPTFDGGYVMAGMTHSFGHGIYDFWLVKIGGDGSLIWSKPFGTVTYDVAYFIEETSDNGFIVTGGYRSFDVCLFRLNSAGDSLWLYRHGDATKWEVGYCIRETTDGGYIVVGYTLSQGAGERDVWLIKSDNMGNISWLKTYGGAYNDEGKFVEQTDDGGYIIAGYTELPDTTRDILVIKVDGNGNESWSKTFGGSKNDEGYCVRRTIDGAYAVVGYTESYGAGGRDVWLLKINASGDTIWTKTYGGTSGDVGYSLQHTSDGGYIMCGYTGSYGAGGVNIYVLKTDQNGNIGVEENSNIKYQNAKIEVLPNPVAGKAIGKMKCSVPTEVELKLYDVAGNEIATLFKGILEGEKFISFRVSTGVYFLRLNTRLGIETAKLISIH